MIHKQRKYAWAYHKVKDGDDALGLDRDLYVPAEFEGVPVTKFVFGGFTRWCGFRRIFIPACVTRFYCASVLFGHNLVFVFDKDNPNYFSDGKAIYTKDGSRLLWFTARADEEYTIMNGCKVVGAGAFECALNLKKV